MIRKFLLPVIAAGLLAGCVTPGYHYRGGSGDYYYGQSVRSVPYGYGSVGYGTRGGWHGSVGYGARVGYGYPYGYYGYYPGYLPPYRAYYPPRYYRPHPGARPPVVVRPRPGHDGPRPPQRRAPWRDLDRHVDRGTPRRPGGESVRPPVPQVQRPAAPAAQPRGAIRSVYSAPRPRPSQRVNDNSAPRQMEP
ncbi:MAG: hypothetical protein Q4F49_09000 [Pseudoxanthomonas suwonensis]|nr:hypothetical protein [Pseudoxanthomonas suwonensis]